jgi:hypothetical protein
MEDRTDRLRDIFLDATGEESVTESQTGQRGSLADTAVEDRFVDAVERMRDRFDFRTDLGTETLRAVVERFYDGETDEDIASALDVSTGAVFTARMDLHLVREATDVDRAALRDSLGDGRTDAEIAAELDADVDRIRRTRRVVESERESRRVGHRFRTEFEEILTDADVAVQRTAAVREDGLDEATEDAETGPGI